MIDKQTISITAILTTYQRPVQAKRALKSVLNQTVRPDEVFVIEDGSCSDLAEWIAGLGRTEVQYLRNECNRGLAASRNRGLSLATGDLVAYIDDDDEWLPDRLARQVERYRILDNAARSVLGCIQVGCRVYNDNGQERNILLPCNQGSLRESIRARGLRTPPSSFLFVRDALCRVGGFDQDLRSGIDHDVMMRLAVAGYCNEIIREPLVIAHRNEQDSMMADTAARLAGLKQYVEKWRPTYIEWFGNTPGDRYARKYFIHAASALAGQKAAAGLYSESWHTFREMLGFAGWRPTLIMYGLNRMLRVYVTKRFPGIPRGRQQAYVHDQTDRDGHTRTEGLK
ncbi:MAG: glycosyltransferase [Gammaproteobacteria bacterium]|nr:glycosyltransferase [Gammaproteobacteria bacterium]